MTYRYTPPEGTHPGTTRQDIESEFLRWNQQAGTPVIGPDYDLPMQRANETYAAVRFFLRGSLVDVKVDKWDSFATNLRCCYLVIRDMRLAEARGIDAAMKDAYAQLPAGKVDRDPYEVLGVRSDTDIEDIEAMYKRKAQRAHPDQGGSAAAMVELNAAITKIRAEKRALA